MALNGFGVGGNLFGSGSPLGGGTAPRRLPITPAGTPNNFGVFSQARPAAPPTGRAAGVAPNVATINGQTFSQNPAQYMDPTYVAQQAGMGNNAPATSYSAYSNWQNQGNIMNTLLGLAPGIQSQANMLTPANYMAAAQASAQPGFQRLLDQSLVDTQNAGLATSPAGYTQASPYGQAQQSVANALAQMALNANIQAPMAQAAYVNQALSPLMQTENMNSQILLGANQQQMAIAQAAQARADAEAAGNSALWGNIGSTVGSLAGTAIGAFGGPPGMAAGGAAGGGFGNWLGNLLGQGTSGY